MLDPIAKGNLMAKVVTTGQMAASMKANSQLACAKGTADGKWPTGQSTKATSTMISNTVMANKYTSQVNTMKDSSTKASKAKDNCTTTKAVSSTSVQIDCSSIFD